MAVRIKLRFLHQPIITKMATIPTGSINGVQASIRYLASDVQPSLFRNGKVGTKRDTTGDDDIWFGNTRSDREVFIHNARDNPEICLDKEGFELHQDHMSSEELNSIEFRNSKDVVTRYYDIRN